MESGTAGYLGLFFFLRWDVDTQVYGALGAVSAHAQVLTFGALQCKAH